MKPKTLTFAVAEVAPLIQLSKQAERRRASYEERDDPQFMTDGKPDPAKIPPRLWLVKDQGIYLMSNAVLSLPEGQSNPVAYAREADPRSMEFDEWWANARDIMGGDDCVESLPIDAFENIAASGADVILIRVTKTRLTIL